MKVTSQSHKYVYTLSVPMLNVAEKQRVLPLRLGDHDPYQPDICAKSWPEA